MKTSESITKIAPAIVKAQGAIATVSKDAENTFFNNKKYATLDVIIEAVKQPLLDNDLSLIQIPTLDIERKPCVITRVQHSSGEYFEAITPLIFSKNDMQGFGAATTYAKRYALGSFFNIATEVDDDANSLTKDKAKQNQSNKKTSSLPKDDLTNPGDFIVTFGTKFKGKKLSEMSPEDVDKNIEYWQGQEKKQNKPLSGEPEKFVFYGIKHLQNIGFYPPTTQDGEIK